MSRFLGFALLPFLCACISVAPELSGPDAVVDRARIEWTDYPRINATVGGEELSLIVSPRFRTGVVLNGSVADRMGLKSRLLSGVAMEVGSETVSGRMAGRLPVLMQDIGEVTVPVMWFDGELAKNADGAIGIGAIPARIVELHRPGAAAYVAEESTVVQTTGSPDWQHRFSVGDQEFSVALRFRQQYSFMDRATISAAGIEVLDHGEPVEESLEFDIKGWFTLHRIAPSEAFRPFGFKLERIASLRQGGKPVALPGQDNVIAVTAAPGRKVRERRVQLGMDVLGACRSIIFNNETGKVTFDCP